MHKKLLTTKEKAFAINLDPSQYGTFAEIGAGQEVANWFFRASATAGTVAKSISAYDMTMSDAIYGTCDRYVSRARLLSMLDHEYAIMIERLAEARGAESTFFSYCNTVRARGYQDSGECHGWMGIRFQIKPNAAPADVLLHIRLLDEQNVDQMEALGIAGVNLIYAVFHYRNDLPAFVGSLIDGLLNGQIEIDMLKFEGPAFSQIDNRLCALQLLESGLTDSAMFLPDGEVVQPAEALYKKRILLLRGRYTPVLNLHLDMLKQAHTKFDETCIQSEKECMEICEISMKNLLTSGEMDHLAFLNRADSLQALGKTVLISNCPEFHRVIAVLTRYTNESISVVLSIGLLHQLFQEKWSENLQGGILESFGRLFKSGVSLLIYPWKNQKTGEVVTAETYRPPEKYQYLYQHFHDNGMMQNLPCGDELLLSYSSQEVIEMIHNDMAEWKDLIPNEIQNLVKSTT